MKLNDILNVLLIDERATKNDFKRAYKSLMRTYYAGTLFDDILKKYCDNGLEDSCDAVSYYSRYKFRRGNNNRIYNSESELSILKRYYKKEVLKELKYIESIGKDDIVFEMFRDDFLKLICDDWYRYIDEFTNVHSLNNYYNEIYRTNYFGLLCCYNYEHYKRCKITSFVNGDVKINKDSSLKEIRDKKIDVIKVILDNVLSKYKCSNDYIVFGSSLSSFKDSYALVCLWGCDCINRIKADFNKDIRSFVVKYYERKKLLDGLIEEYYGVIMPFHTELNRVILNEEEFYELYDKLVMPFKTRKAKKRILRKNKK